MRMLFILYNSLLKGKEHTKIPCGDPHLTRGKNKKCWNVIGGQGPKGRVHSWGHYWGPVAEKWGAFMGSIDGDILGGQGLIVGQTSGGNGDIIGGQGLKSGVPSWGIVGGQGPKSGVPSRGHYRGPGSEIWSPFIGALLGAEI